MCREKPFEIAPDNKTTPEEMAQGDSHTDLYQVLTDISADLMFEFHYSSDGKLELKWIEGRFLLENGYTSESLMSENNWVKLFPTEDKKTLELSIQHVSESDVGSEVEVKFRLYGLNDNLEWMAGRIIKMASGQFEHTARLVGSVHTMESNRFFRNELQDFGSFFNIVNTYSKEICWINDRDTLIYLSHNFENVFSIRRESLFTDPCTFFASIHPNDQGRILDAFVVHFDNPNVVEEAFRVIHPDGSVRWVEARSFPVFKKNRIVHRVGIARDNSEQKQNENQLKQAIHRAEQARRTQDIFLTNVNHLLRTPLTVIMGYSVTLVDEIRAQLTETQQLFLDNINSGGNEMLDLIEHITELATKNQSDPEEVSEIFDIRESIDEVMGLYVSKIMEKGLNLEVFVSDKVPQVLKGDKARIRQVIINLVSNAVTHTQAGDIIVEVDAKKQQGTCLELHIAIRSNPYSPDLQSMKRSEKRPPREPTLFDKGMDLAMDELTASKNIIERMGGLFWMEQETRGVSACHFTINQPILA